MDYNKEKLFWKKKEFISFILSILVLFIHSYFAQNIENNDFVSVLNHKVSFFFSRSLTQFAVPMFFMLSGISFFKGYSNNKYTDKIKSRIFTLIIPYILWNTVWMLWEIFCSYSFISKFSVENELYPLTLSNIIEGIFFYGSNLPFWFIFDLIIFSLAAPLIFLFIRNKYIAVSTVVCLSILSVFGIHLPSQLIYYPMSLVFYLTGAIVGYHYFDFISQKSSKKMQTVSVLFLFIYILCKNIVPQELHITNYLIEVIVFTAVAFALWNVTDIFIERIKPRAIYRRSFAIYALHLNIAIIILKLLGIILPQTEWLEIPKFLIMVISTITIINYLCALLERFFPELYMIFMGNRIKSYETKIKFNT